MKIYLDFDGTVVEHMYPKIGRCNFGCFEVIKKLQDSGHEIILNTYRSECNDGTLEKSLEYVNKSSFMLVKRELRDRFKLNEIKSTTHKIQPEKFDLQDAIFKGVLFIDDIQQDIPLKKCCMIEGNMVDWDKLDELFNRYKIYR